MKCDCGGAADAGASSAFASYEKYYLFSWEGFFLFVIDNLVPFEPLSKSVSTNGGHLVGNLCHRRLCRNRVVRRRNLFGRHRI
jgi:hypothetical protein